MSLIAISLHERLPSHLFAPPLAFASSGETLGRVSQLPFSFEEVTDYFSSELGSAPRERQADHAFFESATSATASLTITITRQGPQVLLRFGIEDEHGMDVLRKFCTAPFFQTEESELLQVLASGGPGLPCGFLPRFDVLCEYDMRPERTFISFFFSPPIRVCAPTATRR